MSFAITSPTTTSENTIVNSTAASSIFGNPLDYYIDLNGPGDDDDTAITGAATGAMDTDNVVDSGGGLGLTFHQSIIIITLGHISCLLSLFGSTCVIRLARKYSNNLNNTGSGSRRRGRGNNGNGRRARDVGSSNANGRHGDLYHRILVLLSSYDLILTSTLLLQPWLIPKENGYPWSFGTTASCSMMGFFMRFTVAVAITNAYLSLFFMMKLIYAKKDIELVKYETPCFLLSFLIPISLGIGGVITGSFNTLATYQICAYGAYPPGCEEDEFVECIRGGDYELQDWIFTGILFLATIIGVIATIKVFVFVRKQLNYLNSSNGNDKRNNKSNDPSLKSGTSPSSTTLPKKQQQSQSSSNALTKQKSIGGHIDSSNNHKTTSSSARQQYASNFSETAKQHIQFVRTQSVLYTL